ncbi:hypothetical protein [Deinococcus sp. LM3]|uniref:hypothetical protein n=1 Tax=Deinococcus sp. LM3 TaxID=1938608 RepID=UPI000991AD79|nr:hypothetical protein [Deinococcus sp. LM3]OOV11385.1 hypothetical protein BXU09_20170 [Deinococcus sp. LM3]OOV11846.1 hypothetical protein BXU09_19770 [Deinococcus sp. LM3]
MITLASTDVPALLPIPGLPSVAQPFLNLGAQWVQGELTRLNLAPDALQEPALTTARTAIAAKALAYQAALTGGVTALTTAATSAGGIDSIKIPGLEVKLSKVSMDGAAQYGVAGQTWDDLAGELLRLINPAPAGFLAFAGVAR